MISLLPILAAVWSLSAVPAQEADPAVDDGPSRAAIAAVQRQEKLESVKPAKKSKLIEFLATAENEGIDQYIQFQLKDFRIGFGQISPVSGVTPAIRYEKPRIGSSELTLWISGAYSLREYQAYELSFGYFEEPFVPDYKGHAYPEAPFDIDRRALDPMRPYLYFDTEYHVFPKETFYGTGPDSLEGNRSQYELEEYWAGVVGGYQFTRGIVAQGMLLYVNPTVRGAPDTRYPDSQDLFDDVTAPGISGQPAYIRYGGSLVAGYYGDPYKPSALIELTYSRFDDQENGEFTFNRAQLDARAFLPLGCRQRVLAGRIFLSHDDPVDGASVPFYLMETLGGSDTLRGFQSQRFADENVVYMSAEYRWEGSPAVEMAVFYDAGKVFPDSADLDLKDLKDSYGLGLRFKTQRKTFLRVDVGHSREGTFAHLSCTPSF